MSPKVHRETASIATSKTMSSDTIHGRYSRVVADALQLRSTQQVIDKKEDVTPKPIESAINSEDFKSLQETVNQFEETWLPQSKLFEMVHRRTSLGGPLRVTMDDVVQGVSQGLLILYEHPKQSSTKTADANAVVGLREMGKKVSPFIKVCLRQTSDILLFEQRSTTVPLGTEDAARVEGENKAYEYVTKGMGRLRRKADSEAQTTSILYKSRDANTDSIQRHNVASYVSNFDMFDTYQQLQQVKSSINVGDSKTLNVTTYKVDGVDPCEKIGQLPQFQLAQLVTQRILAGNVFKEQQRRFRNMFLPDPLSMQVEYLYRLQVLWELWYKPEEKNRHAVSCMSWCVSNGDVLAVGYGIFTCATNFSPKRGSVCIWSIKNPVNPEKVFEYNVSVSSVEFSPYRPQLLAIGLYDGTVEVRDITTYQQCTVAVSERKSSAGYEPITDIKWIGLDSGDTFEIEPFLAVSQDGSIIKYRVVESPHLLAQTHAILDRVEGSPEGLQLQRRSSTFEAVRHPQCLGITLDPSKRDVFYVISNEGVIYKCSTNYPGQHLSLWQTHEGAVYSMEFSPWSPKLFLTCGDDWTIRIWIQGIFKPLVTLKNKLCPVNCAYWSKTHSTVIVAVNRKTVDVWDIRRGTLKPVYSTDLETLNFTLTKFSNCGRSIAIGNEKGKVYMCALEDMPFPPHFQYAELEAAIFKALMPFPDLLSEVKSLGYFGYPKKKGAIV